MNVTLEDLNELKNQSPFAYVTLENIIIKRELDETINKFDEANETIISFNNADDNSKSIDELIIEDNIPLDQNHFSLSSVNADKSLYQQYCKCEMKRNFNPNLSLKYNSIFYKECCYGYTEHDLKGEL